MSNRTNSSGVALPNAESRTSLSYANILPAGGTLPINASGTQFYVTIATGDIEIRPSRGIFNTYAAGTGMQLTLENAFSLLEVRNPNAYPVVFQVFVGFDQFIDNRLVLVQTGQKVVAKPTYPTPNSASVVNITDISTQQFTDINGGKWYALSRVAILLFNPDAGVALLVQKANSVTSNDLAIGIVLPNTSIRLDVSGNYRLTLGGANINAIVSELYEAIPALT